jgi:hypothetical protein
MSVIPRQRKQPVRLAISCKVPEHVAALLKCYAEFVESSQEHVVTEALRLAFRKDHEFRTWLASAHPEIRPDTSQAPSNTERESTASSPRQVAKGSPRS